MDKEFDARTFKSGNSVALRLPKGLGVEEGVHMKVCKRRDEYVFTPADRPKRKFNVDAIWGIAKDLDWKLIAPEDRVFDERLVTVDADAPTEPEPKSDG